MRLHLIVLALALALTAPCPGQGISHDEYRTRRAALAKSLNEGVTVVFGRTAREADDLHYAFFQEPNFQYLTGWKEPDAVLLIEPSDSGSPRELIFLPARNAREERWTGRKTAPGDPDAAAVTGFATVLPLEKFESELRAALERHTRVYTVGAAATQSLKALAPLREVASAATAIARLRMRKSPAEIALLQRAADATVEAHRAAWKFAAPGEYEFQVAATVTAHYSGQGCQRDAYAPIVGSGPNSTILHYSRNSRRMDRGEVLLVDAGGECDGYAADVTRTIPLAPTFTPRQREIYDIVLGAQKAAIAAVKPGATFSRNAPGSLYKIAYDYINSHGKDLHGEPLGKYFIHGLSHHIGLDVHDAWDPEQPLEAGMVITVEPGIYIPEESIGVRIEDMVLVTENGGRLMTGALPREAADIERALRK